VNPFPPNALPSGRRLFERRSARGVTLTEFLVVVAAIGILAVIAVPEISSTRSRVDSAVQSLATTLYAAQREAVTRQHDIVISFDQAQHRALLLYDVNGNGVADEGERVRPAPFDDAVVFGRGIAPARAMGAAAINFTSTMGGLPAVIFHRDGSASSAGGLYLTSARAQATAAFASDARAIEVVRATGRAEWWRYTGQGWTRGY
jgi:prepilin-type N-terminal cleavage/methylation domain-containing protein